jgi:hypothetical protein
MNIWISKDGSHWKPVPLETLPKPVTYPRFVSYPNELPTARAQRWRRTFKDLAEKQHDYVLQCAAYALKDAKSQQDLEHTMKDISDQFAIHRDMDRFIFNTADRPLELTVIYQLAGSTRTHQLTLSLLSPSQQCSD